MIKLTGITKINKYKKKEPIVFEFIKLKNLKLTFNNRHELYKFICNRERKFNCIFHPRTIEK